MFRPTNDSSGAAPAASASGPIGLQGMRNFSDGTKLADPADKLLPGAPKARQKVDEFRRALENAQAIGSVALDKLQDAMERKGRAASRVQELTTGAWNLSNNHPSVVMAMRDLDAAAEEYERAQARSQEAKDARHGLATFVRRMEQWLQALPNGTKVKDVTIATTLLKGERPADGVARLGEELAKTRARGLEAEAAPITSTETRNAFRKDLETQIARGAPSLDAIIEGASESVTWPVAQRSVLLGTVVVDGRLIPVTRENVAPEVDVLSLMLWLNKDLMLRRLDDVLAEAQDDARALSREQRQKKLQQIDNEILALERQEAILIEDAGMPPRGDMDVRAALGCDGSAMESE